MKSHAPLQPPAGWGVGSTVSDAPVPNDSADSPDRPHPPRRLFSRRRVLKTLAAGAFAGVGTVGWTLGVEPTWFEVVQRPLPMAGLPASLAGKLVVQLSDFHVGVADTEYLAAACEHVNTLSPDLILLTGDFINHDAPECHRDLPRVLGRLHVPPLGAFACLGNHDYGRGWKMNDVASRVESGMQSTGIHVLRNAAVTVEGLTIAGIDDYWSPNYSPWATMAGVDGSRDAICLVHNPDAVDHPDHWFKFRGWFLSGHTHGGQCKPPFLPPPLLPVENRNYVAGEYDVGPNRKLYINRGIGYARRARFNCRPEITLFTLTAA